MVCIKTIELSSKKIQTPSVTHNDNFTIFKIQSGKREKSCQPSLLEASRSVTLRAEEVARRPQHRGAEEQKRLDEHASHREASLSEIQRSEEVARRPKH